jgi:hypothetical protein
MAEKRTIELEIQDNSKTLKQQYKEAVVELQKVSAAYGETSDEAIAAAKAAAELKDQIGFTNDLISSFNPDAKFDALSKSFGGVLDGFSAVQGAMGLVGVESAAVEETMLKVQSAMALSQGFQGLMEAKDSFKQLGTVASDTFKSLSSESSLAGKATSALGPIWKAVGLSGKSALSGIRAGIAATGIGLLVVALGAIVAYWDDIKAAVGGVSAEMEKNLELSHQQVENAQSEVELFDLQENSLRLQGKSEEEILKIRQGKLKVLAKEEEEEIKLAEQKKQLEVDASKRNQKFLSMYIQMQSVAFTWWAYLFTGIIDGVSNGIIFLGKKLNSFSQGFQNIMIDAIVLPVETALKGVNELLKIAGVGTINVKGIIGDIKGSMKEVTSIGNKFIQNLEGTSLSKDLFNLTKDYVADPLAKLVFDPEAVAKESDDSIKAMKKGLAQTKNEIAGAELEIRDLKKGSASTQAKDQKDADMSMTEYLIALEAERQANITDAKEKELQELANKYDEMSALADKAGQDTTELTKKYQQDQIDITKKYNDLEKQAQAEKDAELLQKMREADMAAYEVEKNARQLRIDAMKDGRAKELEIIDLAYDSELLALNNQLDAKAISEEDYQKQKALMEEKYGKQINDTNKKFDEEDKARRQEAIQRNADFAKQGLSIISDITEMFGKKSEKQAKRAFAIKKAANIATALVDTYTSANAAYLSQFTPVPDPSSPVRGAVAAGLAIASGLVNVAKIATQKFEGGGSTGAGGSGGGGSTGGGMSGGTQAPSFNVVGNNGLNQLAQLQQQPTQAYVVSGQVTTAQSLDRNRIQNATL